MKKFLSTAALAAILTGGAIASAQAEGLLSSGRIQLAQMNSPGDGLDGRRAVSEGNARGYRMGGGRMRSYRRMRHHRRYR